MDVADQLRQEFHFGSDGFLIKIRRDLGWDEVAFERMTDLMRIYAEQNAGAQTLDREMAEGFWYVGTFVEKWCSHPGFPRPHGDAYYDRAFEHLYKLATWYFSGRCPEQSGTMLPFSKVIEKYAF